MKYKPKVAIIAPSNKSADFDRDVKKVEALGLELFFLEGTVSDKFFGSTKTKYLDKLSA